MNKQGDDLVVREESGSDEIHITEGPDEARASLKLASGFALVLVLIVVLEVLLHGTG